MTRLLAREGLFCSFALAFHGVSSRMASREFSVVYFSELSQQSAKPGVRLAKALNRELGPEPGASQYHSVSMSARSCSPSRMNRRSGLPLFSRLAELLPWEAF